MRPICKSSMQVVQEKFGKDMQDMQTQLYTCVRLVERAKDRPDRDDQVQRSLALLEELRSEAVAKFFRF